MKLIPSFNCVQHPTRFRGSTSPPSSGRNKRWGQHSSFRSVLTLQHNDVQPLVWEGFYCCVSARENKLLYLSWWLFSEGLKEGENTNFWVVTGKGICFPIGRLFLRQRYRRGFLTFPYLILWSSRTGCGGKSPQWDTKGKRKAGLSVL